MLRDRPHVSVGLHASWGRGGQPGGHLSSALWSQSQANLRKIFLGQLQRLERAIRRPATHIDSHLHIHALPSIRSVLRALCVERGIPLRSPREAAPNPSLKARALRSLFSGDDPAFFGIDLMGDFAHERVERALAPLRNSVPTVPSGWFTQVESPPIILHGTTTAKGVSRSSTHCSKWARGYASELVYCLGTSLALDNFRAI